MLGRFRENLQTYIYSPTTYLINSYTPSANTMNQVYNQLLEGVEGFSKAYYPSNIIKLMKSEQPRKIFFDMITSNFVVHAGQVILFELGLTALRTYVPATEAYGINTILSNAARLYFYRNKAKLIIENNARNISQSQSLYDLVKKKPEFQKPFSCGDGSSAYVRSKISSIIYNAGNLAVIYIIECFPGGQLIARPLYYWAYGQNILDYKISINDVCTEHKYEIFTKNNAYVFGVGLSFEFTQWLINKLILYVTGVENNFTQAAVANCVYSYFIVVSYLIDEPLKGLEAKKEGIDFLYPARKATGCVSGFIANKVSNYISLDGEAVNLEKKLSQIALNPYVLATEKLLLGQSISEIRDIKNLPPMNTLLRVIEPEVHHIIVELETYKMVPLLDKVFEATDKIPTAIPEFISSQKQILAVIFDNNTEVALTLLRKLILQNKLDNIPVASPENLLTVEEKDELIRRIDSQILKLRGTEQPVNLDLMSLCIRKREALRKLNDLLFDQELKGSLDIIKEWQEKNRPVINQHSSTLLGFFKQTATAKLITDVIAEISLLEQRKEAPDKNLSVRKNIELKIKELNAEINKLQAYYLLKAKIRALHELNALIQEYFKKLPKKRIIFEWDHYNSHIINTHRHLSSRLYSCINPDSLTQTQQFIKELLEESDVPIKKITSEKDAVSITQLPQSTLFAKVEQTAGMHIKARIINLISKEIELTKSQNKKAAYQDLINNMNDISKAQHFREIFNKWKEKYNKVISTHGSNGEWLANGFLSPVLGENALSEPRSATFLRNLGIEFGEEIIYPQDNGPKFKVKFL